MSVRSRWTAKLRSRRSLLRNAEASVRYWARRAGSARGKQMLSEAMARRTLRRRQVGEAERVLARHPAGVSSVSRSGIALVASFEGFRSHPYRDPIGIWTRGFGETQGIHARSRPVTRAQALAQLRRRIDADYLAPVLRYAKTCGLTLTQQQADALASFAYNLGPGIFQRGTSLGDAMRSRNHRRIADALLLYDKAGGRALPGLTRRRRAERSLYLKGTR